MDTPVLYTSDLTSTILIIIFSGFCHGQPTVKSSHLTSPYCCGLQEDVMITLTGLSQQVQQLEQDLQTEKDERDLLQQKFDREAQRLEAFASKKSAISIQIEYTVENLVYGTDFQVTFPFTVQQTFFINIMEQAVDKDQVYNFTSTEHARYGQYITSMNGLYANNDAHLYWAFIRRFDINNEDCLMNVGVSFYIPEDGEHVVLQYRSWDDPLPGCDGPHEK